MPERGMDRGDGGWHSALGRALASLIRRAGSLVAANIALSITLAALLGVAVLAEWAAGEVYEQVQVGDGLAVLDHPVLQAAIAARTPPLTAAVAFFSNTGGPVIQPIVTLVLAGLLAWRWRSWTPLVLTVVASVGALLLTVLGKDLSGRARPPRADAIPPYEMSPSFPSGHTLTATVIAGVMAYLLVHWFRTRGVRLLVVLLAVLYALAMGLSRVYLGHHWLTDVIAGWFLGVAWLGIVITLHRLWLTARAKHGPQRWSAMLDRPIPPAG